MKGLKQFIGETAAIVRSPFKLISVVGILAIPIMYCGMFLGAFWDPYGKVDQLPVAVVNSDVGAVMDGEPIHIGDDFAMELKNNASFAWHFVDREEADRGLGDQTYYMAIEIPEDFSENTATLTTDHPTPAEIVFLKNEGINFLASQIGNSAVDRLKSELSQEVTKSYARTVLESLSTIADGLGEASDGAGEVAAGAASAKDGAAALQANLSKLASGSVTMQQGIDKLAAGAVDLDRGATELQTGAIDLVSGLSQLTEAQEQLAAGAAELDQGAGSLTDGLNASAAGAVKLKEGAAALSAGLAQLAEANPELAEDASFQRLLATSKQFAAGAAEAESGQLQLAAGADELRAGAKQLADGEKSFGEKLGEAAAGGEQLSAGAKSLQSGSGKLSSGLAELSERFQAIADGSAQLDQGASELAGGLLKLADGSDQLSDKLSDAANQTSGLGDADTNTAADMFANPVGLDVVKKSEVDNYGTGLAPYFVSLGLFVGALLLTVVYSVKEPAVAPKGAWSWFISKAMTMTIIGALQALIVDAVLLYGIGLEVRSVPLFVLYSLVTSMTFMSIIHLFVSTMGDPGRFLGIILLIFQLTSSGGTFPIEMLPDWLQGISAWLPMTYSIAGFKAVISTGDYAALWNNAGVLAIVALAQWALTFAFFYWSYRKEQGKLRAEMAV